MTLLGRQAVITVACQWHNRSTDSGGQTGEVVPLSANVYQVTTNLPTQVQGRQTIQWPTNPVLELRSLVHNFQTMATSLTTSFKKFSRPNN